MTLTQRDRLSLCQIEYESIKMTEYSVKQLSDLAKVSVRTLHYYDEIGLLKPSCRMDNNYRLYNNNDALKLQQILIYKEFGLTLNEIDKIVNAKGFDIKSALITHQKRLHASIEKTEHLLSVINKTIEDIEGKEKMKEQLYQWHSDERQKEYEEYLIEKYGETMRENIAHSKKAFSKLTDAEKAKVMKDFEIIETALVDAYNQGVEVGSNTMKPLLDKHREWIGFMWNKECPKPAYAGLADIYESHPDFIIRYETLSIGFGKWLPEAMREYAK